MSEVAISGVVSVAAGWVDGKYELSDSIAAQIKLADGAGAGEANAAWRETISLAAGDSESIDLTSLGVSAFGATGTLYLASVKLLLLRNTSPYTAIEVDAAAANAWDSFTTGTIGPSSLVMLYEGGGAGRPVTATSKVISIVNNDTTTSLNATGAGTSITGFGSTAGLYPGMLLGSTHPAGTKIAAITSATSLTTTASVTVDGNDYFDFTPPPAGVELLVVGVLD